MSEFDRFGAPEGSGHDRLTGSAAASLSRRALFLAAGVGAAGAAFSAQKADAAPATPPAVDKFIYLAKRKPGFTHDQFVARWRQHGALAMSKPFFSQHNVAYVQAETIEALAPEGAAEEYDAIAYIMGRPHTRTREELDQLDVMAQDELETFSGLIIPVILAVNATVLTAGELGGVTAFLFCKDPARAAPIAEGYKASGADRLIVNVSRTDIPPGEMSSQIPYRAVVEVSASSRRRLKQILGSGEAAPWRKADLALITRECVMWDRVD